MKRKKIGIVIKKELILENVISKYISIKILMKLKRMMIKVTFICEMILRSKQ